MTIFRAFIRPEFNARWRIVFRIKGQDIPDYELYEHCWQIGFAKYHTLAKQGIFSLARSDFIVLPYPLKPYAQTQKTTEEA